MTIGRVSLSKVINKDFVTTIQKMAVKSSSASNSTQDSSSTSWSNSLQSGARIYANSVSSLNSLISYLNVSKETLGGLLDLTDGMLELAKKAQKSSLGAQSRKKLDFKYKELVKSFKEIVDKASKEERNILSKEGLTKLFSIIGLDTETSKTIAEVFNEFMFEGDDEVLASKDVKPKKQAQIPNTAFGTTVTSETSKFNLAQVTSNTNQGVSGVTGFTSKTLNVTQEIVDGNKVVSYISSANGEKFTLGNDGYQYDLKYVDKETGFSVVSRYVGDIDLSTLFLTDNTGQIIKQLTTEETNYKEVKMSRDMKTLLYSSLADTHVEKVVKITFSDFDENGNIEELARKEDNDHVTFSNISLSSDGSHVAYRDEEENQVFFLDSTSLTNDSFFAANTNFTKFDFINTNTLAIFDGNNIQTYEYNSSSLNTLVENENVGKFASIYEGRGGISYIAYSNVSSNQVKVLNTNGNIITTYDMAESDSIDTLSLSYNKSGVVELGIYGKLSNLNEGKEFYKLNGETSKGELRSSKAITKVFDNSLNLRTMADAYRVSNALGALKEQLENNIKTMDKMFDVIGENLDLVRAAGFALLDLSQEPLTDLTADDIAKRLRSEIIKNGSKALSQAENLQPLAIASMMLNGDL